MPKEWNIVPTEVRSSTNPVRYWNAYAHEADLFAKYDELVVNGIRSTLDAFRCNDYKSTGYKDFEGAPVSTMRINDTHRLVFSTIKLQDASIALIHGVILNHDYQKGGALFDPIAIRRYEERASAELALIYHQKSVTEAVDPKPSKTPVETIYDGQLISLTELQHQAIHESLTLRTQFIKMPYFLTPALLSG